MCMWVLHDGDHGQFTSNFSFDVLSKVFSKAITFSIYPIVVVRHYKFLFKEHSKIPIELTEY